ncbi:hypothetical protein AB3M96_19505 [Fredinandcohnia sp. 179-A 10B2 NHS]
MKTIAKRNIAAGNRPNASTVDELLFCNVGLGHSTFGGESKRFRISTISINHGF